MSLILSANDAVRSNEVGHFSFRFLFPIFSSLCRYNKALLSVLVCCNKRYISVLLTVSLNKVQNISTRHLRSLSTERKRARSTRRYKTDVAGWSKVAPEFNTAPGHDSIHGHEGIVSILALCEGYLPASRPVRFSPGECAAGTH